MREIIDELQRLRWLTRTMLLVQRAAVVVAWVLAIGLALVLVDYTLRLPSAMRLVLLALGVIALAVVGVTRYLYVAMRFRPSLTQLALRVERSVPAVSGRLASSVEFAVAGIDRVNPLAERSVRETEARLGGESMRTALRPGRTLRGVGLMIAAIAVVGSLAIAFPGEAATGVARLLLPYGGTEWPARTAVESLMGEVLRPDGVHPRGVALALRARNLTSGEPEGRVDVHFRTMREGSFGPWQHGVLTHQGGGVHERLVDTNAERIELYFATEDARTPLEHVELVPPPLVTRATLLVEPPAYAVGRTPDLAEELGPGVDERGVTERPSLVGSHADLAIAVNKPLPVPAPAAERDAWLRRTFDWGMDAPPDLRFDTEEDGRWRLAWTVDGTRNLTVTLADEHGLTNREPIHYRVTAAADLVPSVTITQPERDETVLPSAVVRLAGEAKDDVAVASIALTAAQQKSGSTAEEDLPFRPQHAADAVVAGIEADLDLSGYGLAEGDVVLVSAVAEDVFELDGARHDPARSAVRKLRIIGELELAAQLRRQLSAVRQNAIRIEAQQAELQDDVVEHGPQPGLQRAQAEIGDRVASQRTMVSEIARELERNRLHDDPLEELIRQSGDLLDYAGRAANKAVEAVEAVEPGARGEAGEAGEAGDSARGAEGREAREASKAHEPGEAREASEPREGREGAPQHRGGADAAPEEREAGQAERRPEPQDDAIVSAQQEVREELADLIQLLDRDEDTWIVQRQLESLIGEQARLEEQTGRLARETIGQDPADLSDAERTELDRIAQQQLDLRDVFRRLIEEMRRRAGALEEMDPQAASGMRTAADTGERREVDRDMQAAAERTGQNQLQGAQQAQQSAGDSLQRMHEDLQETRRARAEELLRQLASLIDSIRRLVVVQEAELIALATAEVEGSYAGRDRAMIRLNQNTESVAAEARAAGQSARRIARALDRAADAQGAAVTALRARPPDAAATRAAEERSLEQLNEAVRLASELEQQTEQDQVRKKREELIAAYRALAEKQVAVRAETMELGAAGELSRRQLVEARRIGLAQEEIRLGLRDVGESTREVMTSEVFSFVHHLLDEWSTSVSDELRDGRIGVDVTDRQQMIADSIARQIEAIEESLAPPEEFAQDQNQGGGSGGGPQPLIPPAAEIKRLHGLEEQVYNQTREIDKRTDLAPGQRRQRVRELGQMQRDLIRLGEKMAEALTSRPPPDQGTPQ